MFLGHFALGLAGKRVVPRASLGVLFLSVQLPDVLWPLFLFAGLEHVRIDPGNTPVTPLDFHDYPWTHSFVAVIGWGLLFAGILDSLTRSAQRDSPRRGRPDPLAARCHQSSAGYADFPAWSVCRPGPLVFEDGNHLR
jgi:hypothetical protein